jgi:fido (protein-threonine AMPylation protein)
LPPGCPEWQYGEHPNREESLRAATELLIVDLLAGKYPPETLAHDTRAIHERLFKNLAPPGHEYYAGTYRGSHQKCLRNYNVRIPSDPRVGARADVVFREMPKLGEAISNSIKELDAIFRAAIAASNPVPEIDRLVGVVRVACKAFVSFLTVHPYVDGNGHVARVLLWSILIKFGYVPDRWPIEPKPPSPYSDAIYKHRSGDTSSLENYVLASVSALPTPDA